jgi:hypothetical protein
MRDRERAFGSRINCVRDEDGERRVDVRAHLNRFSCRILLFRGRFNTQINTRFATAFFVVCGIEDRRLMIATTTRFELNAAHHHARKHGLRVQRAKH